MADPAAYRAASALLCLAPYTPLVFQGQEWAASTPFLYFTDHNAELGRLVTEGRRREFKGFAAFGDEASIKRIPDPQAEDTFLKSKLDWDETSDPVSPAARTFALYREALRLRRDEPALRARGREHWRVSILTGNVLALHATAADESEQCLVIFSLKGDPQAAALPPADAPWRLIFSSNDTAFGGDGAESYRPASQTVNLNQPGLIVLKSGKPLPAAGTKMTNDE